MKRFSFLVLVALLLGLPGMALAQNHNINSSAAKTLHLIDNLTGNDIDLLANPTYTFDTRTTDYESRFKLVFVCGDANDDNDFAFYSNGNWIINNPSTGSGSEATLQVIDINGRIIKSESINGCAGINVNAAPGIYIFRLINRNDVKVQKIVVK